MALVFLTTPIGNDQDISLQALDALKDSDIFYCEDTRKSKDLFKRLAIDLGEKQFYSFHDHSKTEQIAQILSASQDKNIVYMSDAGSPLISDPAYPLLKYAIENSYEYKIISGITSPIYALEVSGLPAIPFTFHGFLGRSKSDIDSLIQKINEQAGTHIFFEGVSRVEKTLVQMTDELPDLEFVIARELTKTYETINRFYGREFKKLKSNLTFKGEFVVLVYNPRAQQASHQISQLAQEVLDSGARGKSLAKLIAQCLDLKVKDVYNQLND